jgi:hypothetical protein
MIERLHLSVLLLVAALVWGVLLLVNGVDVSLGWLRYFSVTLGVLIVLLAAFDLYLWHLPLLHPWFVRRPDLRGTWRASLRSSWVDPATQSRIPPIAGYMVIRQTFSYISLRLITTESRSEMLGAEILRAEDGTYRVFGVYRSEPRLGLRAVSPIHYGGLVLQVTGLPATRMEGHYWTDRDTAGEIALESRRKRLIDDFVQGERYFR